MPHPLYDQKRVIDIINWQKRGGPPKIQFPEQTEERPILKMNNLYYKT